MKRLLIIMIFTMLGCATITSPDLQRLYSLTSQDSIQTPVVFVHGIAGSRLRRKNDKKEIWPRSLFDRLFSSYDSVRLKIDDSDLEPILDAEAYALLDHVGGEDFYRRIVTTLTKVGGYRLTSPDDTAPHLGRGLYLFVYDWRNDLVKGLSENVAAASFFRPLNFILLCFALAPVPSMWIIRKLEA